MEEEKTFTTAAEARDFPTAYRQLQRLLKFCGQSRRLRMEHVKTLIELGKHDEVHSELINLQKLLPPPDIHYLKALLLNAEGNQYPLAPS